MESKVEFSKNTLNFETKSFARQVEDIENFVKSRTIMFYKLSSCKFVSTFSQTFLYKNICVTM